MDLRACVISVRICYAVNGFDVLHLVSIRKNLKFTAIIVTFESDTVGKRADGSVLIFPASTMFTNGGGFWTY